MAREFDELRTRLPPSLNSGNMVRQEPSMLDAIGGEENIGSGAGTLPQPEILNVIDRLLQQQRRNQGIPGPGSRREDLMRLAGDIVPAFQAGTAKGDEALRRRLETPGFWQGSRGAGSINFYGGSRRNPTLDLLQVLQFPGGQEFPTRARGGPVERKQPYLVGENGPETFVPTKVAQAGDFPPLPPGFTEKPPAAPPPSSVQPEQGAFPPPPEGFAEAPPNLPAPTAGRAMPAPPTPAPAAPTAGMSRSLEEMSPVEIAALRMARSAQPPGGRQEGATTRIIENFIPATYQSLEQGAERAIKEQTPEAVLPMATMALPTSVAYRTGKTIAAVADPGRAAQIETGVMSIPRAAEAGKAGISPAIAAAPVGGGPIRRAAETASQELKTAGEAAATRMLGGGEPIGQDVAGRYVRKGIEQATTEALANGRTISPRITRLLNQSDEDIVGSLVKMAGDVRSGADANTLAQIRRMVPLENRTEVQSAIVTRIGQKAGEFDGNTFVKNYGNMSDRGKNLLFGEKGGELRYHLDSLEAVAKRAPTWQRYEKERTGLGTRVGVGAVMAAPAGIAAFMEGGSYMAPLTLLGTVVPINMVARSLAKPASAASMASWSRAYEGLVRSGGAAPAAISSFKIATDNLSNTLGVDFNWTDFFKQARKGSLGPAQRALENVLPEE